MAGLIFEKFADYVLKKEKFKKNFVHQVISQGKYEPRQDYYLQLRTRLISLLRKNVSLSELENIIANVSERKTSNYTILIENIQNFLRGKRYTWIEPIKNEIDYSGLIIKVNPEIGLEIDGTIYYIKMYFKQKEISIQKVGILEKMMQDACKTETTNVKLAIWDIRRCKIYSKDSQEEISINYDLQKEALSWLKYANDEAN